MDNSIIKKSIDDTIAYLQSKEFKNVKRTSDAFYCECIKIECYRSDKNPGFRYRAFVNSKTFFDIDELLESVTEIFGKNASILLHSSKTKDIIFCGSIPIAKFLYKENVGSLRYNMVIGKCTEKRTIEFILSMIAEINSEQLKCAQKAYSILSAEEQTAFLQWLNLQ